MLGASLALRLIFRTYQNEVVRDVIAIAVLQNRGLAVRAPSPLQASNTSRGLSLDTGKSTGNAFSRVPGRFPHTLTGRTVALL